MSLLLSSLKSALASSQIKLKGLQDLSNIISSSQQIRCLHWPDWKMLKDYNKRILVKNHSADRTRILTVMRNDILPIELREIASKEIIEKVPRYCNPRWTVRRCAITSKPRSTVQRWRLGRIVYRHLADNNKLSGVQKAIW